MYKVPLTFLKDLLYVLNKVEVYLVLEEDKNEKLLKKFSKVKKTLEFIVNESKWGEEEY
jgi:hypothetical protein